MSETKPKRPKWLKTGFLAALKESMIRTSAGCGPGCGCHVEPKKADRTGKETEETSQK